jgi:hypothetical protein
MYACRSCSDALATRGDTGSSSARVFALLISALKHLVTSRLNLLGVSAQMHGWVYLRATLNRTVIATTASRRWWGTCQRDGVERR